MLTSYIISRRIYDKLTSDEASGKIVVKSIVFDNLKRRFKKYLKKSSNSHINIWASLMDDFPSFARFFTSGKVMLLNIKRCEEIWVKMSEIKKPLAEELLLYGSFLLKVLNDPSGTKLVEMSQNSLITSESAVQELNIQSLSSGGNAIAIISKKKEGIYIIEDCNLSLCAIFGYAKNEMTEKPLFKLFPQEISDYMDFYLSSLDIEYSLYGLHKSKYIIPVTFRVVSMPSIANNMNFACQFTLQRRSISSDIAILFISPNFEVKCISSTCSKLLGISIDTLQIYLIKLDLLIPKLPELISQNSRNKKETISFYFIEESY